MTQHALITGANRGIGLALTQQLTSRGMHVIATVRKASPELSASGAEIIADIDVTRDEGLTKLQAALGTRKLDLLINNAGVLRHTALDALDPAIIREEFEVNALAPLRLTHALLSNLNRGAKVALLTSRMGSMADNTSGGSYGYRMSKAALNAAGKSLAIDLRPHGISVALLHPGWVKTDMTANSGNVTASESASQLLQRIDGLDAESSGVFLHANGEVLPF